MMRCLAFVALLGSALMQSVAFDVSWPRVVKVYRDGLDRAGIVGSSLVFVRDGTIQGKVFAGYQDQGTKRPVDEDTIYHWASITKMLTGAAILQLRDRGLLSLDDPVVRYVPELREVHNPFGDIAQVRIRHLMTHSAGFRASTWPWGGDRPWHPFEPTRWAQLAAMLPYTELQFEPGTKYSYSNPGVIFLGRIIELLSGDDYEVYVAKHIFLPLGMTRSFFDRAPYSLLAHRSHSYERTDDGLRERPFDFDTGITVSNGGLNAPIGDMTKWLAFLIGGSADEGTRRDHDAVLRRSSVEEMFQPVIAARDGEGASGDSARAGLSCFVERHDGVELIGHSGDQNGFIAHLYLHRQSRSGYLVAFNTNTRSKRDGAISTRSVDDAVRDAMVAAFFR